MPIEILSSEYKQHSELLKTSTFSGVLAEVTQLHEILGPLGPNRRFAGKLDRIRELCKSAEATNILDAVGIDPKSKLVPQENLVRLASTLKFLRHLYMVSERGNQQVWVLSVPKSYEHFPLKEFMAVKTSQALIKTRLADIDEQFPALIRERFGAAMMIGLAWCESAKIVLAMANSNDSAMNKVKRWFADSATTESELNVVIANLQAGFKKIVNTLNQNQVLITDMPSLRADPNFELTEAFIASTVAGAEKPATIYIEKAMFENYQISVLHDMKKNWARVLIHECSHIDGGTKDRGYSYNGIRPGYDISSADALINADSWAFFAADCANALTAGEIIRAFGGTGDPINKLSKNWN